MRRFFHRYDELSILEKLVLRTCCYLPPRIGRDEEPDEGLDSSTFDSLEPYRRTLRRAFGADIFEIVDGKRVLDFGCGEGGYVLALAGSQCASVDGIDLQPIIERAASFARDRGVSNVTFIRGHSSEMLAAETYDVVLSHDSFEHFEHPDEILAEMVRVTKPGGRVLIKFGPSWRGPYGRHMMGTFRRDRPWLHLVLPERTMMRVHSAYHNKPVLLDEYKDLPGGLNKMTIERSRALIELCRDLVIDRTVVFPLPRIKGLAKLPMIGEYFASGVCFACTKIVTKRAA